MLENFLAIAILTPFLLSLSSLLTVNIFKDMKNTLPLILIDDYD